MSFYKQIFNLRNDFELVFFNREFKLLAGLKNRTLIALSSIIFLSLLAFSITLGSIKNLQTKMDNPYTNWVDLPIRSSAISAHAFDVYEEYKKAAYIRNISTYKTPYFDFYHSSFDPKFNPDSLLYQLKGRTISKEDTLLFSEILDQPANRIWKNEDTNFGKTGLLADCEIIISDEMRRKLGFKSRSAAKAVLLRSGEDYIFLTIVAVIDVQLPSLAAFLCSPKLYNIYTVKKDGETSCYEHYVKDGLRKNSTVIQIFGKDLGKVKPQIDTYFKQTASFYLDETKSIGDNNWDFGRLSFLPTDLPEMDSLELFFHETKKQGLSIAPISTLECQDSPCNDIGLEQAHFLAFNFKDLGKIEQFQKSIKEQYNIDIDTEQVEAKSNFSAVVRLTWSLLALLMIFAFCSLFLFIYKLLKMHIIHIRPNLGTFLAFGLSPDFLKFTYLKIIVSFIFSASVIAFLLLLVCAVVGRLLLHNDFQLVLFSEWILLATLTFILLSYWLTRIIVTQIIGQNTPGDLIYERSSGKDW